MGSGGLQPPSRLSHSCVKIRKCWQVSAQTGRPSSRADGTRQDPIITEALDALGRSGVPLYVLYEGEGSAAPHVLPAILTEQIVLDALEEVLSPLQ